MGLSELGDSGGRLPSDEPLPRIAETGVTLGLLDALLPFLGESLMVVREDWSIAANLAPPGGFIGRGLGLGAHALSDMHPEDAAKVLELGLAAFDTPPGWTGTVAVRMFRGDGSYGRFEIAATNCFDNPAIEGMVVRTREVIVDDGQLEHVQFEHRHLIEGLAEVLPVAVAMLDGHGHAVFVNQAACALLRTDPTTVRRDGLLGLMKEADRPTLAGAVARRLGSIGRERCTLRLAGDDGIDVEFNLTSQGSGPVNVLVVTMEDVTSRRAAQRRLEFRASHDDLTGLRNRSSLLDLLRDRLDRELPTTLLYIDLDGFKSVNDAGGHAGGDRLLAAVGRGLAQGMPSGAEAARIGGDEFVVVCDATTEDDTKPLADYLRRLVAAVPEALEAGVTCSVGVSTARRTDEPRDLVHRADQAMYIDKRRDRPGRPAR